MRSLVRPVKIALAALALSLFAADGNAQIKYYGYFGSEYINANVCSPSCGAELTDHSNVVWVTHIATGLHTQVSDAVELDDKVIINLAEHLFNTSTGRLKSSWQTLVDDLREEIEESPDGDLTGHIAAFMPYDEPLWKHYNDWLQARTSGDIEGTTFSAWEAASRPWANLTTAAKNAYLALRADVIADLAALNVELEDVFPAVPRLVTFGFPEFQTGHGYSLGSIPTGFDWVGFDCYADAGTYSSCAGISIPSYLSSLKGKMTSGQRVILIPPGFAHLADSEANRIALESFITSYWSLALNDPDVIGVFPYKWTSGMNGSSAQIGVRDLGASGTWPNLKLLYKTMGLQLLAPMAIDSPIMNSAQPRQFTIGGWAVDQQSMSDTTSGVDLVQVYVKKLPGGSDVYQGNATLGGDRTDVQAAFGGATRFRYSGYCNIDPGLGSGDFRMTIFSRSLTTGTVNNARQVDFSIPASNPQMSFDSPAHLSTVSSGFTVAGWAIDANAPSGAGVDVVHVYATPVGGGSAVFLGAAGLGGSRSDVGAIYGSQFTPSGFTLTTPTLAPGTYDVVVYARSTLTMSYNAVGHRITVQ